MNVWTGLPALRELRVINFALYRIDVYKINRDDAGNYKSHSAHREHIFPDFAACQEFVGTLYQ